MLRPAFLLEVEWLGHVSLAELAALPGPLGASVERDTGFVPEVKLAIYAANAGCIGLVEV